MHSRKTNKNFLPAHPKVYKRSSMGGASTSIPSASSFLREPVSPEQQQQIIQRILHLQNQQNLELGQKLKNAKEQNQALELSLKYLDIEAEKQSISRAIEQALQEQQKVIERIQNCEQVEQSTTPEEYYLWQKKKKTQEFYRQVDQNQLVEQEKKERLEQACINSRKIIEKSKAEIKELLSELQQLHLDNAGLRAASEQSSVNSEELDGLHEEYLELKSNVAILQENKQILHDQLCDGCQSSCNELLTLFENSKGSLARDLKTIRTEIEEGPAEPVSIGTLKPLLEELIAEYEEKMEQYQKQLYADIQKEGQELLRTFDWHSFRWEQYLSSDENKQISSYERYLQVQEKLQIAQAKVDKCEEELRHNINESAECQQKNNEIQSAINKVMRLSLSLK